MSVVTAAAVWFTAPWLAELVSHGGDPDAMIEMLRVLAVVLPIATAYDTVLGATLAYGSARPNVVVEKLGRLPGQILCVLGAILAGAGPTGLAVAWSVPYVFGLIAVGFWCARIVRRRRTGTARRPDLASDTDSAATTATTTAGGAPARSELSRAFWAFTAPRAVGRICQVALQRTDIVLIAALLSPRDAAIYTAATRFLAFGQLGIAAIQQVLAPQLSGLFARGDLGAVRSVFATSTAWLMSMAWPIYLTSAVAAPVLLQVFGGGYEEGHATVVILSLTMLATTATGSVDVVLLMAGRSRQSLVNNAAALVIDVALVRPPRTPARHHRRRARLGRRTRRPQSAAHAPGAPRVRRPLVRARGRLGGVQRHSVFRRDSTSAEPRAAIRHQLDRPGDVAAPDQPGVRRAAVAPERPARAVGLRRGPTGRAETAAASQTTGPPLSHARRTAARATLASGTSG